MQSRLREVEKNFINSTTDSAFNRNAKLLNELRTKAKKMGLSVRTDNQLFEAMDTTRKDKLKRGQLAGYSKGVYNPKTKKREFASAIDDPNRYDIVDFADDLSTVTMVGGGAALAYKIVKNPKLILELPKNVQAGVRAAYNKLKGNKTMAKTKVAKATQAAIFGKSMLSDDAFRVFQNLPDAVQAKLINRISKGKLKTIKGIEKAAKDAQKTVDKAADTLQQRKAKEALKKVDEAKKVKKVDKQGTTPPKTSTKPDTTTPPKTSTTAKPKKDTTFNIYTAKNLKAAKPGARSAGNVTALATGIAGTGVAGYYGAMSAADKLKLSSSEAKAAEELKRTSAKMKDKAGEPVAKKRSTKKKKLAGDELGPSAGAKTTGPKKDTTKKDTTKKDSKATYTPSKGKKKKKSEPKESLKDQFFRQDVRKYGPFTVDSTDRGMSKYGDSENWEELEAQEEMDLRKGGTARRKAFGKGGMYKAPKKTYGMRKGGFTRRGVFR